MNLERINEILNIAQLASVPEILLECDTDSVLITGCDVDARAVIISHDYTPDLTDNNALFHRVPEFKKRFGLFDLTKTKTEETIATDGFVKSINIKQGRKKVSLTLADPKTCQAPKSLNDEIVNTVTLSKEDVASLASAIGTINPEFVTFKGNGEEISVNLVEKGSSDCYTDIIGDNSLGDVWEANWSANIFTKLIKHAVTTDDDVLLSVTARKNLFIVVDDVKVILTPQISDDF